MKEYIVTEHPDFPYEEPKPQELIRCKDCRYWEISEEETYCRELGIFDTNLTSYCSYAKRKEK